MSLVGAGHAGLSLTLAVSCAFNTAMNARCFAPCVMKQHCWLVVVFVGGGILLFGPQVVPATAEK